MIIRPFTGLQAHPQEALLMNQMIRQWGDVHYWKVWHGNRPFPEYRKFFFRYLSEFGFQSFPCKKTIDTFTDDPADWNIFSYVWEKHQRNYGANGKIMNYMQQMYRYPGDFDDSSYASQLLQADAHPLRCGTLSQNPGKVHGCRILADQ